MSRLDPYESNPLVLWAEIHRLRAAAVGPEGFASWQEAATAERVRRVEVEAKCTATTARIADEAVHLALACANVDHDSNGWYALRVDKADGCKATVGRGATAWDAVRNAHAA